MNSAFSKTYALQRAALAWPTVFPPMQTLIFPHAPVRHAGCVHGHLTRYKRR